MVATLLLAFLCLSLLSIRFYAIWNRKASASSSKGKTVAFLHPHCTGGGGGERVLWDAIVYLLRHRESLNIQQIVIYTANNAGNINISDIVDAVHARLGVQVITASMQRHLRSVPLSSYWITQPKYHPFATLMFQSLSAVILAFEALLKFTPNVFIDTTGFAFTYPVASALFGCSVVCYTHYPTISNDMLQRVEHGQIMYNNQARFAQNTYRKKLKLYYYKMFAILYGVCGLFADIVMVNSTWTYNHVVSLFFATKTGAIHIVYPPCGDNDSLSKFELKQRKKQILSIGQFRPEKNHSLQIEAFYEFRQKYTSQQQHQDVDVEDIRLIMVGGVRNDEDRMRVANLRRLIEKLALTEYVTIHENMAWRDMLRLLQESMVGLHTMENEHFGICLVEYMVAGLVTIGHCSGGPLSDIVANVPSKHEMTQTMLQTERGFLCTTREEYAQCFGTVFAKFEHGSGWMTMREQARTYCLQKFSCSRFQKQFTQSIRPVPRSPN